MNQIWRCLCVSGVFLTLISCSRTSDKELTTFDPVATTTTIESQSSEAAQQNSTKDPASQVAAPPWPNYPPQTLWNPKAKPFVAKILSAPEGNFNKGNPPTLEINVIDALGNEIELGPKTYRWDDPLFILCGVGEEARIAKWNAEPIVVPEKGSDWIIYGTTRMPDSEQNRTKLRERLQHEAQVELSNQRVQDAAIARVKAIQKEWDDKMTPERLARWTEQAGLIVVGKPVLALRQQPPIIEVTRVLKGTATVSQLGTMRVAEPEPGLDYPLEHFLQNDELIAFVVGMPTAMGAGSPQARSVGAGVVLYTPEREQAILSTFGSVKAKP